MPFFTENCIVTGARQARIEQARETLIKGKRIIIVDSLHKRFEAESMRENENE